MKRSIKIFLPLLLLVACKNSDPEISEKFIGAFFKQESTKDALISTEWKITRQSSDRVNVTISTSTDYVKGSVPDESTQVQINSVLVAGSRLILDNPYIFKSVDLRIKGDATLSDATLKVNVIVSDKSGYSESALFELRKH